MKAPKSVYVIEHNESVGWFGRVAHASRKEATIHRSRLMCPASCRIVRYDRREEKK